MTYRQEVARRHRLLWSEFRGVMLVVLAIAVVLVLIVASWTYTLKSASATNARERLSEAGYSDVTLSGRHWWLAESKCNGDKYEVYFNWRGVAPNGAQAHGIICKGEWPLGGWKVQY